MRLSLPLAATLVLAACEAPLTPPAIDNPDACGASGLQYLVGQRLAAFDGVEVRGPVRVIAPGTAVTMDYRTDRLNLETNRRNRITRVYCG
ncbi:MAG: I78 family peptidase inhibitor [Gemmobacter sp.]